jgi:hypothetical protein
MKRVVNKVISMPQNAFIKDRQILDSILIANECLDSHIKFDDPGLVCKLDMEKAYDHVNWNFLLYLIRRSGFGEKWCYWIENCISIVRLSILINGSLVGFFSSSHGVRKGGPLSPFRFVIVMEALSRMITVAIINWQLSGFLVGSRLFKLVNISHLFTDNTLVFCGANHIRSIRALLICFKSILGLKVNIAKFVLVPVDKVGNVGDLAGILGCGTDFFRWNLLAFFWGLAIRLNPCRMTLWKK